MKCSTRAVVVMRHPLSNVQHFSCVHARDHTFSLILDLKLDQKVCYDDLSHNNACFHCNITITNFLVSHMCELRFDDIISQSTVPMYSYAKIPKDG